MTMQKFGYNEELLQTRSIENVKEKQESHEKLTHTEMGKIENDIVEISNKLNNNKFLNKERK